MNVSDLSNGADIFVQTRRAALGFDNCVNVMLRPSPSLCDTDSLNKPICNSHESAIFVSLVPLECIYPSFVRSDDISMFLVRISPFEAIRSIKR